MMQRLSVIVLCLVTLLYGCEQSAYPGMDKVGEGIYQHLHKLGEGERKPLPGYHVGLTYNAYLLDPMEKLGRAQRFWLHGEPSLKSLNTMLSNRVEGDSVTLIAPISKLPWDIIGPESVSIPEPDRMVRMEIRIDAVLTDSEVQEEQAFYNQWLEKRGNESKQSLNEYLVRNGIDPEKDAFAGVYVVVKKQGEGELIAFGDVVTLNYRGTFLDGTLFDDTFTSGSPLVFTVGAQGQVIWGMSLAVRKLSEGASATIYIPYSFAFGSQGSSTVSFRHLPI